MSTRPSRSPTGCWFSTTARWCTRWTIDDPRRPPGESTAEHRALPGRAARQARRPDLNAKPIQRRESFMPGSGEPSPPHRGPVAAAGAARGMRLPAGDLRGDRKPRRPCRSPTWPDSPCRSATRRAAPNRCCAPPGQLDDLPYKVRSPRSPPDRRRSRPPPRARSTSPSPATPRRSSARRPTRRAMVPYRSTVAPRASAAANYLCRCQRRGPIPGRQKLCGMAVLGGRGALSTADHA